MSHTRVVVCLLMTMAAVAWWTRANDDMAQREMIAQASSPPTVTGRVVDDEGPVVAALVSFQGIDRTVKTDAFGYFSLDRAESAPRLTAWKEGYLIAGAETRSDSVEIRLRPLPAHDNEDYRWVSPHDQAASEFACAQCHETIYQEWQTGAHAGSARNRRVLNLLDGTDWQGHHDRGWNLLHDHPHGASVCAACHAPTMSLADPTYGDLQQVSGVAADGVHCDFCHKVQAPASGRVGLAHGRFGLQLLRPTKGQLFFGPLPDVDRGEDTFSPFMRDSRFCASCHEGTVFGVPVYTTYTEWLDSPARRAGKHCQQCHMAPTGRMTNFAPDAGGIDRDAQSLASHDLMPGGRAAMLRRCLTVTTRFDRVEGNVQLTVAVRADNVGHRVPTGFIDRHLLLVVEGFSRDEDQVALLDGPRLGQVGDPSLIGLPGRLFGKQLLDPKGAAPTPFWREHGEIVDTRLFPKRSETSEFTFSAAMLDRARVRLLYRRSWHDVATAKQWPDNEIVIVDRTLRLRPRNRSNAPVGSVLSVGGSERQLL